MHATIAKLNNQETLSTRETMITRTRKKNSLFKIGKSISQLLSQRKRKHVIVKKVKFDENCADFVLELQRLLQLMETFYESNGQSRKDVLDALVHSLNAARTSMASVVSHLHPIIPRQDDGRGDLSIHDSCSLLMQRVHQFYDAYLRLSAWLDQQVDTDKQNRHCLDTALTDLQCTPTTPPVPSNRCVAPIGLMLVKDFRACSIAVLELLRNYNPALSIDPTLLAGDEKQLQTAELETDDDSKPSIVELNHGASSLAQLNTETLTSEDRALLKKLWTLMDTLIVSSDPRSAPPKPSFPGPQNSAYAIYVNALHNLCLDAGETSPPVASGLTHNIQSVQTQFGTIDCARFNSTSSSSLSLLHSSGSHCAAMLPRHLSCEEKSLDDTASNGSVKRPLSVSDIKSFGLDEEASTDRSSLKSGSSESSLWDSVPSEVDPLDETHMQESIAAAILQQHDLEEEPEQAELYNPLSICSCNPLTGNPDSTTNTSVALYSAVDPSLSQSEFKTRTESDWELIEVNGKKYRRYFQRQIVIQRHRLKQVVLAPMNSEGTGPDLAQAVPVALNTTVTTPTPLSTALAFNQLTDKPMENVDATDGITQNAVSSAMKRSPQPKPLLRCQRKMLKQNRPLTNYIFRFGVSAIDDLRGTEGGANEHHPEVEYFKSKWATSEVTPTSLSRSKTMTYAEQYKQLTDSGATVKHSTCVEHTTTVRPMSELDESGSEEISDAAAAALSDEESDLNTGVASTVVPSSRTDQQEADVDQTLKHYQRRSVEPQLSSKFPTSKSPSPQKCETILKLVNADHLLTFPSPGSPKDPPVLAGPIDALIVHLTNLKIDSASESLYLRIFMTTYRSFLSSESLIDRLITRFNFFRQESSTFNVQTTKDVCSGTLNALILLVSYLDYDFSPCMRLLVAFQKTLDSKDGIKLQEAITEGTKQHLTRQMQAMVNSQQSAPIVGTLQLSASTLPIPVSATGVKKISLPLESEASGNLRKSFFCKRRAKAALSATITVDPGSTASLDRLHGSMLTMHRVSAPSAWNQSESLLLYSARELAEQLTYIEARKFDHIRLIELLDIKSLEKGKAPGVSDCALHFSGLSNWAMHQLLTCDPNDREKLACLLVSIMSKLKKLHNYSGFLALLCSFLLTPEKVFTPKIRSKLKQIRHYMQPPSFSTYRKQLLKAQPPFIPYLGLMMQDLIMLAQGNPLYLREVPDSLVNLYEEEYGPIVNFWRCYKHFTIIQPFCKQLSTAGVTALYSIKPNERIQQLFNHFHDCLPESDLRDLANQMGRQ